MEAECRDEELRLNESGHMSTTSAKQRTDHSSSKEMPVEHGNAPHLFERALGLEPGPWQGPAGPQRHHGGYRTSVICPPKLRISGLALCCKASGTDEKTGRMSA